MATVNATLQAALGIKETFDVSEVPAGASPTINSTGFNKLLNLHSGTTPPASKASIFKPTLTAGALTIDLTAVPKSVGGTISAAGLKLRAILFNNPGSNAVVIAPGASNGYELNGGDDKTVLPGATWIEYFADGLAAIDGTHKELDLAGTGTDVFECVLLFG